MNNETKMPWNYDILNIISIASYLLSIQNLQLNQQDLSNNTLNEHYLNKIIQQNKTIITLLKGGTNEN